MTSRHPCPWLDRSENRANLARYQSILRHGDPDDLQTLPQDFLEQWSSAKGGAGAFHYAAGHGLRSDTVVPFLVSRGLCPNALSANGRHPLGDVLNRNQETCIQWCHALFAAGSDIRKMPCQGASFLVAAVQSNREELVLMAIERGASKYYPAAWGLRDHPSKPMADQVKIFKASPNEEPSAAVAALDRLLPPSQEDLDRQFLMSLRVSSFGWARRLVDDGASLAASDGTNNNGLHLLFENASYARAHINEDAMTWVSKVASSGVNAQTPNSEGMTPLLLFDKNCGESCRIVRERLLYSVSEGIAQALAGATLSPPGSRRGHRL